MPRTKGVPNRSKEEIRKMLAKADLMKSEGLSYEEIAKQLGVHYTTIFKWRNKVKKPRKPRKPTYQATNGHAPASFGDAFSQIRKELAALAAIRKILQQS